MTISLNTAYQTYVLDFKFEAGTSRGVLTKKDCFFIKIWEQNDKVFGLGEAGPLSRLSPDDRDDFEEQLKIILRRLEKYSLPVSQTEIYTLVASIVEPEWPSIRFAMETALLDLLNGGKRIIFQNDFSLRNSSIPINGLVWIGSREFMLSQVSDKVAAGFDCIKMKLGSLDFEAECHILEDIRSHYDKGSIMLRVDANGAFQGKEALEKLKTLNQYNLHSIEQPIRAGDRKNMKVLCQKSPLPIALDEELIGVNEAKAKHRLLDDIRPEFIILKPTLLGGMASCLEWITFAEEMKIGWWLTSALESNIGLNAISQFACEVGAKGYQGLGTGQLYHNNIPSPLQVLKGKILYNRHLSWDLSTLKL